MYSIKNQLHVAFMAIRDYRKLVDKIRKERLFLSDKKFHMEDPVVKKSVSSIDMYFGLKKDTVGKIVGYDNEYNYYRVYFNELNPYVGVKEDELELYKGE